MDILSNRTAQRVKDFVRTHGLRWTEQIEAGERFNRIELPAGRYRLEVGFPVFDPGDDKWLYMNNDEEMQHIPVEIDVQSPRFKELHAEFRRAVIAAGGWGAAAGYPLLRFVHILDRLLQLRLTSSFTTDHIRRLSELLVQGSTACAGKAAVAAALAVTSPVPGPAPLLVQMVGGDVDNFATARDFGHQWVRFERLGSVVLYDPYYGHITPVGPSPAPPFCDYGITANYAACITWCLPIDVDTVNGLTRYSSPGPGGTARAGLRVSDDRRWEALRTGRMRFDVSVREPGELLMRQGALWAGRTLVGNTIDFSRARHLYPLHDLERLS